MMSGQQQEQQQATSSLPAHVVQSLVEKCVQAKTNAYAPYSNFRVGCALLTEDGQIYVGVNVENSSYGLAICAERTAICKAVSEGHRRFRAIAVSSDLEELISPCGACRQFIAEFGMDCEVLMTRGDNSFVCTTARQLLPFGFEPSHLQAPKQASFVSADSAVDLATSPVLH